MKKKRKRYQTVQPTPEPAPEPEKMKITPISAGRVQVGDIVKRKPITFSDHDRKEAGWMLGRVIWIHPLGRFHVVEFCEGRWAVRESFMGVRK